MSKLDTFKPPLSFGIEITSKLSGPITIKSSLILFLKIIFKPNKKIKNNMPKLKKITDEVLNKRFINSTFQKQD